MPERKADDSFFDPGRKLVRHSRLPALPGSQHLQAMALDHWLPAVVPGAAVAVLSTGLADSELSCLGEQQQAMAKEQTIISHGRTSSWASSTRRMRRRLYLRQPP